MVEMFPLNSADATYTKLRGMLSTLGDPFTRIISPKSLTVVPTYRNTKGLELEVMGTYKEWACERLDGIDSETAAQRLRGNAGTTVTVKVKDSGTSSWIRETAAEDLRNAIQELENQGVHS
ncbi:hypothetical protein glysoja_041953 [Glycine soja]|uniref:Uncharacterized protein n=1 Tax=Glycine soja TaxID=3848 RepID=A0A0B2PEJ4_GLYSO|nr:hypothetical protein JHK87_004433 [Glycine soja]KAG5080531.1 hypothetical protein JHK86_004596 [Glycine max]KHN07811.1 hypothetical protein glysoja_041953 [Glycine soja]